MWHADCARDLGGAGWTGCNAPKTGMGDGTGKIPAGVVNSAVLLLRVVAVAPKITGWRPNHRAERHLDHKPEPQSPPNGMPEEQAFSLAKQHYQAGQLAAARTMCEQMLARMPGHPEWLNLLGIIAHKSGDEAAAVAHLRAAIESSGHHPQFYKNLGAVLRSLGDTQGAKQAFLDAARRTPSDRADERAHLAQYLRANLHDDYAASQAVVVDDAHAVIGPFRIRLESASACNLRCQHCPTGVNYEATDRTAMKMALFERVLGQMKRMPTLRECVLYLGGEPLMNKHLVTMCQRVKRETSVKRTLITTNAMLLSDKACARLATAMLDQIFVSVDGRSPEENDAIRVRADYSQIVENVARLRRHLKGTATQIVISHAMIRARGDPDTPVTPEFLQRDFPGIPVWSDYATRWPGFDIDKTTLENSELKIAHRRNFCDFPFFELAVRANGEVVLCCHDLLGESVMGNVYESELADIWNGPAYRELRRHMLRRDASGVHKVCRKCFIFTGERIVRKDESTLDEPALAG